MDKVENKYFYCVVKERESKNLAIQGMEGKEVYALVNKGLAAIVSDTSKDKYDFIREHLTTHQRVIEDVMKEGYDVLPVRFGTVTKCREDIEEKLLQRRAGELLETFPIVEGRVELGLRAIWQDMPRVFQEIVTEHKEIQRAKELAQKKLNRFQVAAAGELVKRALDFKREKEADRILKPLIELAVDFKERELLGDSMILSSAFLVAKEKEGIFDQQVKKLEKDAAQKGITFKYFGPIPPFNFVELHLRV